MSAAADTLKTANVKVYVFFISPASAVLSVEVTV